MNVNYEFYKVFFVVAQELSFSKAAKKLFISQSAVSQSIRQLEEKLEVSLFNRSTKQVQLTADGKALFDHIEPAIHMISSGETYLMESKTLERGQLHIAASDTICRYYLLSYFKTFHNAFPGVEIKITNRTSVQCVDLLHKGQVDLIVTNLPNLHVTGDMAVTPTKSFKDVFIAHPKRCDTTATYSLEDLSTYPLLMLTKRTATSEFFYDLFKKEGIDVKASIELGSIDLLVDMARIDLGIAFVPDFCVTPSANLQILNIDHPIPERQIGWITHKKRPLSEAAKKFVQRLQS